ncbi:hypothetical protein BWI17_13750 [Betaproteobacteria bacterium GR16-43]|nr:hypothetical protein BWI17_13750 [Betaproteobacteria bacterium GR16-43]
MEIAMKPTVSKDPKGEGSYAGTRQYNEGVKDHVQHHDIEKEARDAEPRTAAEAQEMKDAEREGASRSKGEDPSVRKSKPSK